MKSLSILIVSIALVTFTGSVAFSKDWSAAQKEVWKMQEAYYEARKAGVLADWSAFYHKDSNWWGAASGLPADKTLIKNILAQKLESCELKPRVVDVFGNIAIVYYHYKLASNIQEFSGRMINIWMKQENNWKIIGGMMQDCNFSPPCP